MKLPECSLEFNSFDSTHATEGFVSRMINLWFFAEAFIFVDGHFNTGSARVRGDSNYLKAFAIFLLP